MNQQRYREKLIDEVKKYPVLYDTTHQHHRDIDVRDRCWQEISGRLGASSEALKREWKILRDSMRQAIRRSKQGAASGSESARKWRFQNRMAFVLPHITHRTRHSIIPHMKLDDNEDNSEQEAPKDEQVGPMEAWAGTAGAGAGANSGADEGLELFFASVCQSAKRLSRRHQGVLKSRVLEALLRAEEDNENDQDMSDTKQQFQ